MNDLDFIEKEYPLYTNGSSKRKIRHNFFSEIKTELQAYILGLLASDGCVNEKMHSIVLGISDKDEELFEYLKVISPDARIDYYPPKESKSLVRGRHIKGKGSKKFVIQSKILYNDIIKYGIVEGKTYLDMHIPNINKSLIRHFIRGYFDGDGWVTFHIHEPNKRNREINPRVKGTIGICSKTSSILTEIQKELADCGIFSTVCYVKRDDMYKVQISSKQGMKDCFNYFYKDAKYFLKRKYNKFDQYANTEVTQLITEYRNAQKVNVNESNNPSKSVEHPIQDENVR